MKLEIIKETHEGKPYYSIRKKIGFISIYKTNYPFYQEPTLNRLSAFICSMLGSILTVILGIFFIIKSLYFNLIYIGLLDIILFFYYNYSFRVLDTLYNAEEEIKEYLRVKIFRKEIVQSYDIKKNEIIVEKK